MNLYLHFPFCRRKCAYCALYSVAGRSVEFRKRYCGIIARQISALENNKFESVYFGGGTPLQCDLEPVLIALNDSGGLSAKTEVTVEVNPQDVTPQTMRRLRTCGVNRISMGVQSFNPEVLEEMGRGASAQILEDAIKMVRDAGFDNVGIDLIAGWPGDEVLVSVQKAIDLGVDHLSLYSLMVEPNTVLAHRLANKEICPIQDDAVLDDILAAQKMLEANGIFRYEVSNYARRGFECKYNLAVWRGEDYLGFGPGAYSRIGHERWHIVADASRFVSENGGDTLREGVETVSPLQDCKERTILRMRLAEGFSPEMFDGFTDGFRNKCEFYAEQGLMEALCEGKYRLTPRGFEVCDSLMVL